MEQWQQRYNREGKSASTEEWAVKKEWMEPV
jgi:hypothetical protein